MEKRRAEREVCNLKGRIVIFGEEGTSHECRILDLTAYGALIRVGTDLSIPREFELMIGDSPLTYPSRLARVTKTGIGVEFLDPLRDEIANTLMETLFRDELLLEVAYGTTERRSPLRRRVNRAVEQVLDRVVFRSQGKARTPHDRE